VQIDSARYPLRDLVEDDRVAFVTYQTDPRYRALYDIDEGDTRANALFDLFMRWQREEPRLKFQLGIFERKAGRLCGSAGLRMADPKDHEAELGVELAPHCWGRYRLAMDVVSALIYHGFNHLGLLRIFGRTASGNRRVEKLARWFGAEIAAEREGDAWMSARGWKEVDWSLSRTNWARAASARPEHRRAGRSDEKATGDPS
jgi:ribosomal-protein-alanine N-acetyltransferase